MNIIIYTWLYIHTLWGVNFTSCRSLTFLGRRAFLHYGHNGISWHTFLQFFIRWSSALLTFLGSLEPEILFTHTPHYYTKYANTGVKLMLSYIQTYVRTYACEFHMNKIGVKNWSGKLSYEHCISLQRTPSNQDPCNVATPVFWPLCFIVQIHPWNEPTPVIRSLSVAGLEGVHCMYR